jgi:hypothetical protein
MFDKVSQVFEQVSQVFEQVSEVFKQVSQVFEQLSYGPLDQVERAGGEPAQLQEDGCQAAQWGHR